MADWALVVGIEQYESRLAPALQGPALDALRFALWLSENRVPAGNILLFVNQCEWPDAQRARLQEAFDGAAARGIKVRPDPVRTAIMEAWRKEPLSGAQDEGTLWLYWSGHGLAFPEHGHAVLCAGMELCEPSYIFLKEFRDSLRSVLFHRFTRQRLIVDACAEYFSPEALNIRTFRNPFSWTVEYAPDQVELSAVAMGSTATAEEGGSLFSRILFEYLEDRGWPDEPRRLYEDVEKAISAETRDHSKLPRVRIMSPRFEAGIERGNRAEECRRLLQLLWNCRIPLESYHPVYLRTMGDITSDPQVLSASTLTDMVRELLELKREEEFGDRSLGIIEFFERLHQKFENDAKPILEWLKVVPPGALESVREKLKKESRNLVLTIRIDETSFNPNGFPVSLHAMLTDANFTATVRSWDAQDLIDQLAIEKEARFILEWASALARRTEGELSVQVFANPPLMGIPWHAIRLDPEDEIDLAVYGQLHSFVLRSRARLTRSAKYDLEGWKQKTKALRIRPCNKVAIIKAPSWTDSGREAINDELARIEGMLLINDALGAPVQASEGLYKVLTAALRRGLSLASWPVRVTDAAGISAFQLEKYLGELLNVPELLAKIPALFLHARKSESWARQTALFWDDNDADVLRIQHLIGDEPDQL